ncbi:MAG: DnaA regulatory inactivator Hda [Gammaproteobacteria bacterium]|nr:MAG: DnaA regulatory inactivator Hda [Gammaproteobacteria bacterium]
MNHPQLPLGLALRDSARFASFFPGPNAEAVRCLQLAAVGEGETLVFLSGDTGLGKTHLLQAACHEAARREHAAAYLPLNELKSLSPELFDEMEAMQLLCIDDVDAIAGLPEWEAGLFHLFNRTRESGSRLLITGSGHVDRLGIKLPDLVSRLGWGVTYTLKPIDNDSVHMALMHRARSRGLELPEETAAFLLKRIPRDLPSVFTLLDRLDEASMVEQRRLTIPFVKAVLDEIC